MEAAQAVRRAPAGAGWDERCAALFEDLRKPARVMVHRAFGRAFSPDEVEDVYANAWTSTLAALRGRERSMTDDELRSYLLTAVANHASKEMRRRSRKPASPLEDVHAQVVSDPHQLSPDERATGSETGSQARDVLSSLPKRRRAVMLLRYGWGLEPKEICRLVEGLSPRAYRKEITRGVEQMIERFRSLEAGEWCSTREPLLRDYVAGTADEDEKRQALEHIAHCRACHELVTRLHADLHELATPLAWLTVAGTIGDREFSVGERLSSLFDRGRDAAATAAQGGEAASPATAAALGTGARGAGALGTGLLAHVAGIGTAAKVAIGCIGVAGVACVAGGVTPLSLGGGDGPGPRPIDVDARGIAGTIAAGAEATGAAARTDIVVERIAAIEKRERQEAAERRRQAREEQQAATAGAVDGATDYAGAPATSPAPTAPPAEQEFGLPSAASDSSSGSTGPEGSASPGDVAGEFGP
jgi:RNA polymerase sigma factor (sigma-70 family)